MAVVAAGKLDDLVTAGEASGGAEGAHHRFGAAVDHAHHLDVRHHPNHLFGHLYLEGGRRAGIDTILFCPSGKPSGETPVPDHIVRDHAELVRLLMPIE